MPAPQPRDQVVGYTGRSVGDRREMPRDDLLLPASEELLVS
jgi:hypothetical protein